MHDQSCVNVVPRMTNPAVQFSVHSLRLTARGVQCISTFPSIPALNASSVSLAGFSCSVLNSVLPAAAQVPAWTGWQLPRYSCRVTVTPSGFSVSTALTAVREEVTWGRGQEYYPLQTTFYSVWNWPKIEFVFKVRGIQNELLCWFYSSSSLP